MNTKQLALFFLRLQGFRKLTYYELESEKMYMYRLENCVDTPYSKEIKVENKEDLITITIDRANHEFPLQTNKNPIEITEEIWLNMPDEDFIDKVVNAEFHYYFLLFPYIIEGNKESLYLNDKEEYKIIEIKNLYEIILIREFFSPATNNILDVKKLKKEGKVFFSITVKCLPYNNCSGFFHHETNKTIFRSYITQLLIEKTLNLFESPYYEKYELLIPEDIMKEFMLIEDIQRNHIEEMFRGPSYEEVAKLSKSEIHILESRILTENFIFLL